MLRITKKIALFAAILLTIFTSPAPRVQAHGNGAEPPGSFIIRGGPPTLPGTGSFINYEIPHVHPLDINSASTRLAACNTPDGMVEIYSVSGATGNLTHIDSIRVGYAPVSARFRTTTELWVVNHISDSISIVDITSVPGKVIDTIHTYDGYDGTHAGDEPADVVFVTGDIALVSGSRSDTIQRYTASTGAYLDEFTLDGEDPRMLAANAAGTAAYAAVFESGNGSTGLPIPTVALGASYGGQNPPFNNGIPGTAWIADGASVVPNDFVLSGADPAPEVALIVKKDGGGAWRDDNGDDWSDLVSGANAAFSGRVTGWDLMDNDIGILTSADGFTSSTFVTRQMNHVMAIAINPENGDVWGVGTDATNEIRFEPNLTGTFTRVMLTINDSGGVNRVLLDLNEEHLDAAQSGGVAYEDGDVTQVHRNKSIGDPRGIAFNTTTDIAYISGMGSDNVVGVNSTGATRGVINMGARIALGHTIEVGHGPTGIAHHATKNRLYVLNKFDASITVIDTGSPPTESTVQTLPFYDPTPDFINVGRVHLYGTHENSGLGQLACASCHVDARMDRLAWDLGNPAGGSPQGVEKFVNTSDLITGAVGTNPAGVHNFIFGNETTAGPSSPGKFHTMKGPMTTQTMQDIIRHEPHHWRGDRDGIEEFAGAFPGLQGADDLLDAFSMQEFEDFLSTIHFPPSPFRALDHSLPGGPPFVGMGSDNPNLPLPGHVSPGTRSGKDDTFSAKGTPLPSGDAWQGFIDYVDGAMDGGTSCVNCHALPMGSGPAMTGGFLEIPLGPNGEAHLGLVDNDGTGQRHIKIPQLRNQMDKEGFFTSQFLAGPFISRAGFGTVHNGILGGGLARFLGSSMFNTITDQDLADIVAFSLCINGDGFDDLFELSGPGLSNPPIGTSRDAGVDQTAHTAVGHQVLTTSNSPPANDQTTIDTLVTLADSDKIGLIATGGASAGGWFHLSGTGAGALFKPDDGGANITLSSLQSAASVSDPLTFMAVPTVSDIRMGADRDEDDVFNGVEDSFNSDNANPDDHKWIDGLFGGSSDGSLSNPFTTLAAGIAGVSPSPGKNSALHIQTGNYNETMTITKRTHLVAIGGTVLIGAP